MKKLYLRPWEYNCALLMDAIDKIVIEKGGELKGYYSPGEIYGQQTSFDAVKTNHCDALGSHTSFILDGDYYYLELDDNPFFDFFCQKIPVESEEGTSGKFYLDVFPKTSFPRSMYFRYNETDLNEVAHKVFDELISMKKSQRYTTGGKTEIRERTACTC